MLLPDKVPAVTKYHTYHLKNLVWFHGWTPTHWALLADSKGVKARCTWASGRCVEKNCPKTHDEISLDIDTLGKTEMAVPGSIPAMMGFDFVICDGEPGSALLNKPLNFRPLSHEPSMTPLQ